MASNQIAATLRSHLAVCEIVERDLEEKNLLDPETASSRLRRRTRGTVVEAKTVGLIGSRSRLGQAAQAAGSIALPGDFSNIRSPVRAAGYAAITPGGGSNRNILGRVAGAAREERGYRCPVGYQYGGRFTDENYSTCGMQLFDIPSFLGLTLGALAGGAGRPGLVGLVTGEVEEIRGGTAPGTSGLVGGKADAGAQALERARRMAEVPEVGGADNKKRDAVVDQAVTALKDRPGSEALVIRRDGLALQSLLPSGSLRKFSDNPDMQEATFIRSLRSPQIDQDDVGLLAGTGIREVIFQVPGGRIMMTLKRELTVGERRSFGRMLNSAAQDADPYDPTKALKDFANRTNNAIAYTEKFEDKEANSLVDAEIDGSTRQVRKWVYDAFYSKDKK